MIEVTIYEQGRVEGKNTPLFQLYWVQKIYVRMPTLQGPHPTPLCNEEIQEEILYVRSQLVQEGRPQEGRM